MGSIKYTVFWQVKQQLSLHLYWSRHFSRILRLPFFYLWQDNLELMLLTFIGCHLLGMSSASINPVLYGFLNESFRKEFLDIFDTITLRKRGARAENAASELANRLLEGVSGCARST